MKPRAKALLASLARVDWPRTLQRASVLARALRGDARVDIQADHVLELERAAKLHGSITNVVRQAAGCTRSPDCKCIACAFEPIVSSACEADYPCTPRRKCRVHSTAADA